MNTIPKEFENKFLLDPESTGRFIVVSKRTGKKYFVEPIVKGNPPKWGDVNPATKQIEGDYGDKNKGAVREEESMITEESGFKEIVYSGIGGSPLCKIDELDAKYPTLTEITGNATKER